MTRPLLQTGLAKFALAEYERRKQAMALALSTQRVDETFAQGNVWLRGLRV